MTSTIFFLALALVLAVIVAAKGRGGCVAVVFNWTNRYPEVKITKGKDWCYVYRGTAGRAVMLRTLIEEIQFEAKKASKPVTRKRKRVNR